MSSGSSAIDPIEFDEARAPTEAPHVDERRRRTITRRRASRTDTIRPNVNAARREAQDPYSLRRRRPGNARQRSSGQQTESMRPPVRMLAQGSYLTIMVRMLPSNDDLPERPDNGITTIRLRIEIPETREPVTVSIAADNVTLLNSSVESNPNTPPESPSTTNIEQSPDPATHPET